jgi:hypothetical protein
MAEFTISEAKFIEIITEVRAQMKTGADAVVTAGDHTLTVKTANFDPAMDQDVEQMAEDAKTSNRELKQFMILFCEVIDARVPDLDVTGTIDLPPTKVLAMRTLLEDAVGSSLLYKTYQVWYELVGKI